MLRRAAEWTAAWLKRMMPTSPVEFLGRSGTIREDQARFVEYFQAVIKNALIQSARKANAKQGV
jgi:hypothetical protein